MHNAIVHHPLMDGQPVPEQETATPDQLPSVLLSACSAWCPMVWDIPLVSWDQHLVPPWSLCWQGSRKSWKILAPSTRKKLTLSHLKPGQQVIPQETQNYLSRLRHISSLFIPTDSATHMDFFLVRFGLMYLNHI